MKLLKEELKENKLRPAYLFYGDEDYLRDYYINSIVSQMVTDPEFNYLKYNNQPYEPSDIAAFLDTPPLMSEKKVLVLKNTGLFKRPSASEKAFWAKAIADLPEYVVVLFSEQEVDKRSTLFKAVKDTYHVVEFPYQERHHLISWSDRVMRSVGGTIERKEIEYLLDLTGPSMLSLKNELDKLANYCGSRKVTTEDIDNLVSKSLDAKVFAMMDELVSGNISQAMETLSRLRLQKEQPVAIISLVFRQFSSLRKLKLLEGQCSLGEMAKRTGLREFVVKKYLSQLKGYPLERLNKIILACQRADHQIKSGKMEQWLALETLFVTCVHP
ncbi:MAG: DNA polymerase III subunit delta [Ruminococcaceae bacterium]|nr:DNA polymerase III subunit delta [Oscillospiraceae bacterium]